MDGLVVFGADDAPAPRRPVSEERRLQAMRYVNRMLSSAAPRAIRFQTDLMQDDSAPMKLRFQASEAILDRFMGKAAQEVRLGVAEDRPIVFSEKLRAMSRDAERALDAAVSVTAAGGTVEEAVDAVARDLVPEAPDRTWGLA